MLRLAVAALVLTLAAPALGQDASAAPAAAGMMKAGRILKDESGARIGKIEKILADGSARVIFGDRFVTIPAANLKSVDGAPVTTMTKHDIAKMP